MHARAIETRYKGYRFRSRLEARWAVFFDALGLKWEYEPEGFELPDGVRYLPDFLLYNVSNTGRDCYVEVKPLGGDASKLVLFTRAADCAGLFLDGPPDLKTYRMYYAGVPLVDGRLGRLGSNGRPKFFRVAAGVTDGAVPPATAEAVHAARGARFEHGEDGAQR